MKDRALLKGMSFREVDEQADIKFNDFERAWRSPDHKLKSGKQLSMKDTLTMFETPMWIPKVINNAVQEAVEPKLIATSLLQRLPFDGIGVVTDLPVLGALDGDFEVGEGEAYPELRVTYGPGAQIAKAPAKYGLAVKFTEEVIRYSQFDIMTMVMSQAGKALARNKEEKIFNMWYQLARTTHDNFDPLNSAYGTTTGRDLTGAQNGSLTMDDLFEMYAQVLAHGYTPNLLFMHPLTWLMFIGDAQLRAIAQASGGPWFGQQWSGNPVHKDFPDAFGGMALPGGAYRTWPGNIGANGEGEALPNGALGEYQNMQAGPVIPGFFGFPLRVVVSPWVPFDVETNTTHLLFADSAELGFFIEEHGPQIREWKDPENDILKMKLTERYTIRPKNRGLGLAIAKNIAVDSNKIILPAMAHIDVAGSIGLATRNVSLE